MRSRLRWSFQTLTAITFTIKKKITAILRSAHTASVLSPLRRPQKNDFLLRICVVSRYYVLIEPLSVYHSIDIQNSSQPQKYFFEVQWYKGIIMWVKSQYFFKWSFSDINFKKLISINAFIVHLLLHSWTKVRNVTFCSKNFSYSDQQLKR